MTQKDLKNINSQGFLKRKLRFNIGIMQLEFIKIDPHLKNSTFIIEQTIKCNTIGRMTI